MEIDRLLDELEDVLEISWQVPLSGGKAFVDTKEVKRILEDVRLILPVEVVQAKKIVDFLQGSIYAMNGSLQKLGGGIFLCAPNNVNIEGKITDENAKTPKNSKKDSKDDEEEFSW